MILIENFRVWLEILILLEFKCMQIVFSKILICLKDIGFDKIGLSFVIFWLNDLDVCFCVKVFFEGDYEWCEMFKDIVWFVIFVVVINCCIEVGLLYKCR